MKNITKLMAVMVTVVMLLTLMMPMSLAASEKAAAKPANTDLKVMILSDTHFISESMIKDTAAFRHAENRDQKVLVESEAVLDAQLQRVRDAEPDVLLMSGDLTKDGEYANHKELAKKLRALKKDLPDLKVYVINGNHDINNPNGRDYNTKDGKAVKVKKTTQADFRKLYSDITWEDPTVREVYTPPEGKQAGGLSYMARPKKGYTVIAIDSNCYSPDNTSDGEAEFETRGNIQEDLMKWVLRKIRNANARGDTVIGLMHHGVVAHLTQEPVVLGSFLVDDYRNVATQFADAGMHYVFTGHMHAQDIARMTTEKGNTIYDFETGSTVTYPCPLRAVWFTRSSAGTADTDNMVKETVQGSTLQNLSIAHTDPLTGEWKEIPDMTAYAKQKSFDADVIMTTLKDVLRDALGSNYPAEFDTVIEKLIPDLANMPVTMDGKHTLIEAFTYAHQRHLAGVDSTATADWFAEARTNLQEGKILASVTDVLCRDLAVLVGNGVNKLTETDLVKGPAVEVLHHTLFAGAHVGYFTVPKLATDLNEFLLVTLDSFAYDHSYKADREFTIKDANAKRSGPDYAADTADISSSNVAQMLFKALLGQ